MALGLGAGVYFEYYRRPTPEPTRFITGLNRATEAVLVKRMEHYASAPEAAVRAALHENALWFNLDRQPTTALLGMEMLAEELIYYDTVPDWRIAFHGMARVILETGALYRRTFVSFLNEVAHFVVGDDAVSELQEIAGEWTRFGTYLEECAGPTSVPSFEQASRMVRRLAFREEHFWGKVLDY